VTTNDAGIADTIRMLRDHGQAKKYYHDIEGYNGRLDAMQAGFLNAKLAHLANWNTKRRDRAADYNRLLAGNESLRLPHEPSWSRAVYHLYVIRTNDRDGMIDHLKSAGIGTGIHYPVPLHRQKAYAALNYSSGDFPVAERVAAEIVSLPMFPQLAAEQQARVTEEVLTFISKLPSKRAESEENLLVSAEQTA
jgi:dTDP-4-amino-4,6-dideoxygalactose transaminase